MAYQNEFNISNVPVTCTKGGDHSWLTADFKINAYANSTNTAYIVEVYARIDSSGEMNWSGAGDIRVTCNGKTASKQVSLAMYNPGTTTWDGPATFEFGAPGEVKLNMDFDLDLTRTTGFSGRPGVDHNKDGGSLQHFYYNGFTITIGEDGGLPPLATPPVLTLKYASRTLDTLTFNWTSDKPLGSSQYRIDSGSWINSGTGTSGTITIDKLTPNTDYTVEFKGVSTAAYGSLSSSNVPSASGVTLDMARIIGISDCIFGSGITINIDKAVTNDTKLAISTFGNNLSPEFIIDVTAGTNTFIPTQAQLDQMYRCFSNSNSIPLYFNLKTIGQWKEWFDDEEQKSLELTGNAKTAHVGGKNNEPRRAQTWIGIGDKPRRAIVWVGDINNKPRRCI